MRTRSSTRSPTALRPDVRARVELGDPEQQRDERAARDAGSRQPDRDPEPGERHSLAQHEREDAETRGAQRRADTDLTRRSVTLPESRL